MKEIPNLVTILADILKGTAAANFLLTWENTIFSTIAICTIAAWAYFASRKKAMMPSRLQSTCELFVSGVDGFVCGIIGARGRKFTPFIGTLFVYIILMNLFGLIPLMKSSTSSWSVTLALALCVFAYVQYAGIRELGLVGYLDHMLGRPRGILAFSLFVPAMLFVLHVISELVRPISLSLRLRSNIWGDDMLLTFLAGFGIKGLPLLLFNSVLAILASVVQAVVFCLLTTIYFALILSEEAEAKENGEA